MKHTIISDSFDGIDSKDINMLKAAAARGPLTIRLWTDEMHRKFYKADPVFTMEERLYFCESIKYIAQTIPLSDDPRQPEAQLPEALQPRERLPVRQDGRKRVVVTGCYDFFHTGHIRFFEEASQYGELHVVIGSDRNVELLKGKGHPSTGEAERLNVVQSIKFVREAHISTGTGWMDAEPEIDKIRPDIYAVNEDGDRPEKREFCESRGIEYLVLKRLPKEGLPARTSTDLRGY